jgi:uncharacterized protein
MGPRTEYAPGTFCWIDLATPDLDAAAAFYSALFGWAVEPPDPGADHPYRHCRRDGATVAALTGPPPEGAPPAWTGYVSVADTDTAAARAVELGGTALVDPLDVAGSGRMAVLADPQGAVFAVWQAGGSIGAEWVNDVGCLCNNELATTDLAAARAYYEALFGWTTEDLDTGPDGPPMVTVRNGDSFNANLTVATGTPAHWRPYLCVTSVTDANQRVEALGGQILVSMPIPAGAFSLVLDPQGALLGLFEGSVDP